MKISELFSGKKLLAVIILVLLIGSSVAIYFKEKPDNSHVMASGTVEVTEVQLAPLAGGRIEALEINESDHVKKGQFIARLSMDGADDDLEMAASALAAAEAQLKDIKSGFRKEDISRARAELSARAAQYEQAKRDEKRFAELAADGVVAKRDAELFAQSAKMALGAMNAAADQVKLLENGARPEQIAAAAAQAERARAAYKKVQTLSGYKEVYAPADGVVLTKNYQVGDVIAPGAPLATIGDMNDCWVKLYIPSTQLALVKLGQECEIHVDPFKEKRFKGKVVEINQQAEYNPRMSLTQDQRANMVFWIKISIDNSECVIKPGMPADVTIL